MEKEINYDAPSLDVIDVNVENGFATSGQTEPWGQDNPI